MIRVEHTRNRLELRLFLRFLSVQFGSYFGLLDFAG
jgi:hypothetical protein